MTDLLYLPKTFSDLLLYDKNTSPDVVQANTTFRPNHWSTMRYINQGLLAECTLKWKIPYDEQFHQFEILRDFFLSPENRLITRRILSLQKHR